MTLSKKQKKLLHAALIGFVTGALTALQLAMITPGGFTETKALVALGVGILTGGIGRAAGALLESMQTTDSPNPPA